MIKTFSEFINEAAVPRVPKIVYTPEKYKTAYDIVSQYYDGDVVVTSGQGYSVR